MRIYFYFVAIFVKNRGSLTYLQNESNRMVANIFRLRLKGRYLSAPIKYSVVKTALFSPHPAHQGYTSPAV